MNKNNKTLKGRLNESKEYDWRKERIRLKKGRHTIDESKE